MMTLLVGSDLVSKDCNNVLCEAAIVHVGGH